LQHNGSTLLEGFQLRLQLQPARLGCGLTLFNQMLDAILNPTLEFWAGLRRQQYRGHPTGEKPSNNPARNAKIYASPTSLVHT
jgi:hypothetical protein